HRKIHLPDGDSRKGKIHECETCGEKFARRTTLVIHQQRHLDENDPEQAEKKQPFKCEQCGVAVRSAQLLKGHMLTHSIKKQLSKSFPDILNCIIIIMDDETVRKP
ncbi:hypothetical protein PMAYCL1PPCAC_03541, partial [Pristionchus mayeri]